MVAVAAALVATAGSRAAPPWRDGGSCRSSFPRSCCSPEPAARGALAFSPGDDPHRAPLVAASRRARSRWRPSPPAWAGLTRASLRGAHALRRAAHESDSLQAALASATGDVSLRVAFPLSGDDRWIDGDGEPVAFPTRESDRAVSLVTREDRPIAACSTTRRASTRRRLSTRSAPRRNWRSTTSACAPRRAPSYASSRCRGRGSSKPATPSGAGWSATCTTALSSAWSGSPSCSPWRARRAASPALDAADVDLHRAIDELRELAHGIHPVELSDEGLAAALETLADRAPSWCA